MFKRGIIISIQPTPGSAFDSIPSVCDFAIMAEDAGAVAVKIEGIGRIEAVKTRIEIPVIGIIKEGGSQAVRHLITPKKSLSDLIFSVVADYVATESLAAIGDYHGHGRSRLIYEADSIETSKVAQDLGVAAIATTLYGYTEQTQGRLSEDPDFKALKELSETLSSPVIAEGRYRTASDLREAIRLGAHSICIGTAVTRPDVVIKQFVVECGNMIL